MLFTAGDNTGTEGIQLSSGGCAPLPSFHEHTDDHIYCYKDSDLNSNQDFYNYADI